jgi:hypothetical protein
MNALGLNAWLTPVCRWQDDAGVPAGRWAVATSAQAPARWSADEWATVCATWATAVWPSLAEFRHTVRAWADARAWGAQAVGSAAAITRWDGNGERSVSQRRAEPGTSLDRMALVCEATQPEASRLQAAFHEAPVSEVLWTRRWCLHAQPSQLLRLRYSGPQWEQVGLLQYLAGFADSALTLPLATEQVLADLRERCRSVQCQVLSVAPLPNALWSDPEAQPEWCGELGAWRTDHPCAAPTWA